jgi:hypothetical protein
MGWLKITIFNPYESNDLPMDIDTRMALQWKKIHQKNEKNSKKT